MLTLEKLDIASFTKNQWRATHKQYRQAFCLSLIVGLVAHGFVLTNLIITEDGTGHLWGSNVYMWRSGRWLAGYYLKIHDNYVMPFVQGALAIFYLSVAGSLTASVLRAKTSIASCLIGVIFVTFPSFASAFSYQWFSDVYALSALLSVIAVVVIESRHRYRIPVAAILLVASLALYQAFIAVAGTLVLFLLIQEIYESELSQKDIKCLICKFVEFGGSFCLAAFFYILSLKTCTYLYSQPMNTYKGMDAVGFLPVKELPVLFLRTYRYLDDFMSGRIFSFVWYQKLAITALLMVGGISVIYKTLQNKTKAKGFIAVVAVSVLLASLIPLAFSTSILAPKSGSGVLTAFGLIPVFAGAVHVTISRKMPSLYRTLMIVIAIIVVLGFVNRCSVIYLKGYLQTNASLRFSHGLAMRVAALPAYDPAQSKLAVVGGLYNKKIGGYSGPPFTEQSRGFWHGPPGFAERYNPGLRNRKIVGLMKFLGIQMLPAGGDAVLRAQQIALKMPVYPEEGSVKHVEDLAVVNLGRNSLIKDVSVNMLGGGCI